ncbi:uncharacterized protein LOC129926156 [Biomphalaria glabrata]|uniref:Uncharacterized protein LOC129926156 n=1 Tax=Biomphalaria glabrata TaxID=6526 RepID=A0A9W3AAM1_BIOGL|nr:uncharacterized protein LOC129926156 [Biomphalaria glabrata]
MNLSFLTELSFLVVLVSSMARTMSLKKSAQNSKMLFEYALDNCLASAKKTYTVVERDRILIKDTRLGKFSEKCLSRSLPPYQKIFQSLQHEIVSYENSNRYQWLEGRNANIRKKFLNFKSNVTFLNQDFGRMFTLMKCQSNDVNWNVSSHFNQVYAITAHVLRKYQKLLENCRKVTSKIPTCKKKQKKPTATTPTTMAANGMVTKMKRTHKK